jgi:DHA1 family bicyclomycin/chloramphenicol resistance-like MFS transporter
MSGPVNRDRPLIMVLGSLMALGPLSIDLYLPSFPLIAVSLAVAPTSVELSLAAFFSGFALGQPVYGRLADRWGRRPIVLFGLSLYVVASLACAGAQSLAVLVTARFIQALGGCAGIVVARAVVRDRYETQEAARVFSLLMLVMGVAPILAPLLGGAISQAAGWRALFVVLAVTGVICWGAVFKMLPETVRSATASGPWFSVFQDRAFVRYALAGGVAYAGMFAYITGAAFVFIGVFGIPAQHFGWVFSANAAALITSSQCNRWLLRRYDVKVVLRWAFPALALAGVLLALAGTMGAGVWAVAVPLWVYVGILGMTYPNTTALALQHQGAQSGAAAAWLGAFQFALAAGAAWMVSQLHDGSAQAMTTVVGLCGVSALMLYRRGTA